MASKPKAIPAVKPVSAAVAAAVAPKAPKEPKALVITWSIAADRLAESFTIGAFAADAKRTAEATMAAEVLSIILALRTRYSGADYLTGSQDLFGTGGNNKLEGFKLGTLRPKLLMRIAEKEAARLAAIKAEFPETPEPTAEEKKKREEQLLSGVNFNLSKARDVAAMLADPTRFADATTVTDKGVVPTMRALTDKALKLKQEKSGKAKGKKDKAATAPSTSVSMTAAQAIAHFGVDVILAEMADVFATDPKTNLIAINLTAIRKSLAA